MAESSNSPDRWDFFLPRAAYISRPADYIWARVLESARAADTVLSLEKTLSKAWPPDKRFAFELRNGVLVRQYSSGYTQAYDRALKGMVERRMRLSILSVASFWHTAWVNAGQPDLSKLAEKEFTASDSLAFKWLNTAWLGGKIKDREHE